MKNAEYGAAGNTSKNKKILLITAGTLLLIAAVVICAVGESAHLHDIIDIEYFNDMAYIRQTDTVNSDYNAALVIAKGELLYDEAGAEDILFGVSADSPLLVRISEMYQWQETISSGSAEYELIWSEELIPSAGFTEAGHENPAQFPSNTRSNNYTALNVTVSGYSIVTDLLVQLENRAAVNTLPDISVRGFYTDGSYITNSENTDAPKLGDVRIRYEYVVPGQVTVTGRQREENIVSYKAENDFVFYNAFNGSLDRSDVIDYYKDTAIQANIITRLASIIMMAAGSLLLLYGYSLLTSYKPEIIIGKLSVKGIKALLVTVFGFALAVCLLTFAIIWASVSPAFLLAAICAVLLYLIYFISSIIKYQPKRVRPEKEYVPILIRQDDAKKRRGR